MRNLLHTSPLPVTIFTDNNEVPTFITTNASRRRSWNSDMKYHFILDFIRRELVPFPRVISLRTYLDFGITGIGTIKNSFCCHTLGMLTDEIARRCNDFKCTMCASRGGAKLCINVIVSDWVTWHELLSLASRTGILSYIFALS